MTSMNISLPDEMKGFVDEQVTRGGYSTASEYVRALLREAQRKAAQDRLETLLLEGLDSEPAKPLTDEDWQTIRRAAMDRLSGQNRQ